MEDGVATADLLVGHALVMATPLPNLSTRTGASCTCTATGSWAQRKTQKTRSRDVAGGLAGTARLRRSVLPFVTWLYRVATSRCLNTAALGQPASAGEFTTAWTRPARAHSAG